MLAVILNENYGLHEHVMSEHRYFVAIACVMVLGVAVSTVLLLTRRRHAAERVLFLALCLMSAGESVRTSPLVGDPRLLFPLFSVCAVAFGFGVLSSRPLLDASTSLLPDERGKDSDCPRE